MAGGGGWGDGKLGHNKQEGLEQGWKGVKEAGGLGGGKGVRAVGGENEMLPLLSNNISVYTHVIISNSTSGRCRVQLWQIKP